MCTFTAARPVPPSAAADVQRRCPSWRSLRHLLKPILENLFRPLKPVFSSRAEGGGKPVAVPEMGYGEFCIQELAGEWSYPGGAVAVPSISAYGKDGRLTGQRPTLDDTELTFSHAGIILLLLFASWELPGLVSDEKPLHSVSFVQPLGRPAARRHCAARPPAAGQAVVPRPTLKIFRRLAQRHRLGWRRKSSGGAATPTPKLC
jgi:hypothetical protein